MSWAYDFRHVQKLKNECIFESFKYCYFSKIWCVLILLIQTFFWSVNFKILVCKLCLLSETILDFWPVLILEMFSSWDIKKGQFQFLVTFSCFFLVCKLHKSGLYIITYFEHGRCFIWGFLVFIFLVFSVFKYLKLAFSSNISGSGNVKVLVCKLYMPGL